jgi:D-amino-acid dehydrogenase
VNAGTARVVVVGGGIVGASVAYHLARQAVPVTIVTGTQVGAATDAGAGIICPWTDRVEDAAYQLAVEGARYYPELIAALADDGESDTGYARVGALCVADDRAGLTETATRLRSRLQAMPEIGDIADLDPPEPSRMFPPLAEHLSGVRVSGAARIDGRKIRDSLIRAAARNGAQVVHGSAELSHVGNRTTGVIAADKRIEADVVVVAAGAWTEEICAPLGWELAIGPQRGQILHVQLAGADSASWPVVLPGHDPYLLSFPEGRVVFGATRESDAGFDYHATAGGIGGLLTAVLELAPGLREATMLETRIGFRPATRDGLPLLGRLGENLVVAAGNGPEGLTAGVWTGRLAAVLALDQPPVTDLVPFDPMRFG